MLPCGHPDGARMIVSANGGTVDRCWACEVEADIRTKARVRSDRHYGDQSTHDRRQGRLYPRRTIALGPPYDDGTIP